MKVAYILSGTTLSGGATKSFLTLLYYMIDKGVEVIVITPDNHGVYELLISKNIKTYCILYYFNVNLPKSLVGKVKIYIKRVLNYIGSLRLRKILKRENPDIIHSNTTVNDVGYNVAKWLQKPHIWHIREYGDKDFNINIRKITKRLFEENNYSIAITKNLAKYRNVLFQNNNRVIYNGIIKDNLVLHQNKKENYFLYAGRIEPAKGFQDCIKAFIKYINITKSNSKLYLAGEILPSGIKEKNKLEKEIKKSKLTDYIVWLGVRDDIADLMSNATATIIPSKYEGFGRVMPEAMSVGCLVIARNTGGSKEQMDNGIEIAKSEIALRFNTIEELTEHLVNIHNNGLPFYTSMVSNAFKVVSQLYTYDVYGDKILNFYNEIINK